MNASLELRRDPRRARRLIYSVIRNQRRIARNPAPCIAHLAQSHFENARALVRAAKTIRSRGDLLDLGDVA